MSWLFSRALVAEYSAADCSDGAQSAPSSGTPTPQAYLWPAKTTAAWKRFPSGMTCRPLTDDRGEAVLTSFLAAFPAQTSPSPEKAQASTDKPPACGDIWRESSVRYDRNSCSWRTHRSLLVEDLRESSVTLPRWGSMRDGVCWERVTSGRPTNATASGSLLPTPTATTYGSTNNGRRGDGTTYKTAGKPSLATMARNNLWPTPTTQDAKNNGGPSQQNRNTPLLNAQAGGPLSPTWVEWLMGWPLEWTALDASAMDRFQQWRQQHGACLGVADETP